MDIAEMRLTCGGWDEEMGCTMDNAESECPIYQECKLAGDAEEESDEEEEETPDEV